MFRIICVVSALPAELHELLIMSTPTVSNNPFNLHIEIRLSFNEKNLLIETVVLKTAYKKLWNRITPPTAHKYYVRTDVKTNITELQQKILQYLGHLLNSLELKKFSSLQVFHFAVGYAKKQIEKWQRLVDHIMVENDLHSEQLLYWNLSRRLWGTVDTENVASKIFWSPNLASRPNKFFCDISLPVVRQPTTCTSSVLEKDDSTHETNKRMTWVYGIPENLGKGFRVRNSIWKALSRNYQYGFTHIKHIWMRCVKKPNTWWKTSQMGNWVAGLEVSQPAMGAGRSEGILARIAPL